MSQRIHDPTETGLPECSTTGTLRETLEKLKLEQYYVEKFQDISVVSGWM